MASFDEALYRQWFPLADGDGDMRVTGADAVKFFGKSGLPKVGWCLEPVLNE
jgi:EH domain-containing protein 1